MNAVLRPTLAIAALVATSLALIQTAAGEETRMVGIAPTDGDIEAMRRTVKRLEKVINQGGTPEKATPLISPMISDSKRQEVLGLIEQLGSSLPEDSAYHIRSDFTRATLVPTGTERVQLQITATQIIRFAMHDESLQIELEAVERDGRRQWLLREIGFPGQQSIIPEELSETPKILTTVIAGAAGLLILWLVWLIWRRRRGRGIQG